MSGEVKRARLGNWVQGPALLLDATVTEAARCPGDDGRGDGFSVGLVVERGQASRRPGLLRVAWMLLMQPMQLRWMLQDEGVLRPGGRALELWRQGRNAPGARWFLGRCLALTFLVVPVLVFLTVLLLAGAGVGSRGVVLGIVMTATISLAFSLFWSVSLATQAALAPGAATCLLLPLVAAGHFGDPHGAAAGVVHGVVDGLTWGLAGSAVFPFWHGRPATVLRSQVLVIVLALTGPFVLLARSPAFSAATGAALVAAGLAGVFRLPIYLMECVWSAALYGAERILGVRTLRLVPVLHHELSYLPLPFLAAHLQLAAHREDPLVREVLVACSVSPGQAHLLRALDIDVDPTDPGDG